MDVQKGTIAVEAGLGVRVPTGTFSAAAGVKFLTQKGVSWTAEAKVGFVVKVKARAGHRILHQDLEE